jgi:hypothetical protein
MANTSACRGTNIANAPAINATSDTNNGVNALSISAVSRRNEGAAVASTRIGILGPKLTAAARHLSILGISASILSSAPDQ